MIQEKLDNYRKERIQSEITLRDLTKELLNIVKSRVNVGSFYKTNNTEEKALFKVINLEDGFLLVEMIQIKNTCNYNDQYQCLFNYSKEYIFKSDNILGDIIEIEEELFNQYKSIALFLQDEH